MFTFLELPFNFVVKVNSRTIMNSSYLSLKMLLLASLACFVMACDTNKSENSPGSTDSSAPPASRTERNRMSGDDFAKGTILHNIPDTMRVGKKQRIEVRLTRGKDRISIVQNIKGSQKVRISEIKVGKAMGVKLIASSQNFEILAHSSEIQAVGRRDYTLWEWDVTPLKDGKHDLYLKVIVRKGDYNKDLPVFDKSVQVVTTETKKWSTFFNNNKEWIMGSLVIPLLFLIASRLGGWRRPKRKKTTAKKKTPTKRKTTKRR